MSGCRKRKALREGNMFCALLHPQLLGQYLVPSRVKYIHICGMKGSIINEMLFAVEKDAGDVCAKGEMPTLLWQSKHRGCVCKAM